LKTVHKVIDKSCLSSKLKEKVSVKLIADLWQEKAGPKSGIDAKCKFIDDLSEKIFQHRGEKQHDGEHLDGMSRWRAAKLLESILKASFADEDSINAALRGYLDSHIADYADILSEEVQAKPVAAFAQRISEHFKSIGLSLRLLQNCSTRKLNDIRHLLSFRFDEAKQEWVELEFFPGVSMPKLPNAAHVCREQAELLDKYKFHYDFEAQTATVEFLKVLQGCLESTIKRRKLAGLDVDLSEGVVVNYKVDSAGVGTPFS